MEYWVVRETDFDQFIAEVNRFTQGGWTAQGGMSVMRVYVTYNDAGNDNQMELFEKPKDLGETKIMYCQALVAEIETQDEEE